MKYVDRTIFEASISDGKIRIGEMIEEISITHNGIAVKRVDNEYMDTDEFWNYMNILRREENSLNKRNKI